MTKNMEVASSARSRSESCSLSAALETLNAAASASSDDTRRAVASVSAGAANGWSDFLSALCLALIRCPLETEGIRDCLEGVSLRWVNSLERGATGRVGSCDVVHSFGCHRAMRLNVTGRRPIVIECTALQGGRRSTDQET